MRVATTFLLPDAEEELQSIRDRIPAGGVDSLLMVNLVPWVSPQDDAGLAYYETLTDSGFVLRDGSDTGRYGIGGSALGPPWHDASTHTHDENNPEGQHGHVPPMAFDDALQLLMEAVEHVDSVARRGLAESR